MGLGVRVRVGVRVGVRVRVGVGMSRPKWRASWTSIMTTRSNLGRGPATVEAPSWRPWLRGRRQVWRSSP